MDTFENYLSSSCQGNHPQYLRLKKLVILCSDYGTERLVSFKFQVWIVRDPSKAKKPVFVGSPFTSGSLPSKFTNSDELTELLEHNTIEKGDGYEVRVYPSSKWVCTKEYDVDPINDPMNDWQENVSTYIHIFPQFKKGLLILEQIYQDQFGNTILF